MKKIFYINLQLFFILFFSITFTSCSTKIKFTLQNNGSIQVEFSNKFGKALNTLLSGFLQEPDKTFIEPLELSSQLQNVGFHNIKSQISNLCDLDIKMLASPEDSPLYTSQLLKTDSKLGTLEFNYSSNALKDFYYNSDEQIQMFLDMLLIPCLNDEQMSVDEYLYLIASFYGNEVAKEIKESIIEITTVDINKKSKTQKISLAALLCQN